MYSEKTFSICPVCARRLPARIARRGNALYLEKECPQHGAFSSVIWKNKLPIQSWYGKASPLSYSELLSCPDACAEGGLCPEHKNGTCCIVMEVTDRCDLRCRFCFADKKAAPAADPPAAQLRSEMKKVVSPGRTLIQLSGGEPAMRDDLPEIVRMAKELGCRYVQMNTNGLRLANDEAFVKELADAGLSFVFLQFDGMDDGIYQALRGRAMLSEKLRAVEMCAKYNIGVTLVPTVVLGVNDKALGDILRFAVSSSPAVRGVHFQPAAYLGRIPHLPADSDRLTLDELMEEIERQSGGLVSMENLAPSQCDHPLCGFHGGFVVQPDRTLYPMTKKNAGGAGCCCGSAAPADKNREFIGSRWQRGEVPPITLNTGGDMEDMDFFISRVRTHGFTVTAMLFQDVWNIDLERLSRCSLHAVKNGRLLPFCVKYMTLMDGNA